MSLRIVGLPAPLGGTDGVESHLGGHRLGCRGGAVLASVGVMAPPQSLIWIAKQPQGPVDSG